MSTVASAHGNRCSCRVLASLTGCDAKAIGFIYRQTVLMKHWLVECNHGCPDEIVESVRSDKCHDVGPLDPIKAILIGNG